MSVVKPAMVHLSIPKVLSSRIETMRDSTGIAYPEIVRMALFRFFEIDLPAKYGDTCATSGCNKSAEFVANDK